MTSDEKYIQTLLEATEAFTKNAENELLTRWKAWKKTLSQNEIYEVISALLARQVSLAVNFARAPEIWNGHISPIVLRAMADVYISLAWILEKPAERSQQFILYGLGQQKLQMEHRKKQIEADGKSADDDPLIEISERWINSQRFTFLTTVDVGSWSGLTTRQMAEEAGCLNFYNYVYTPFSPAVHSMWNHIAMYNLEPCANPLHRYHNVPTIGRKLGSDTHDLYLAAKYLNKAFAKFDEKTGIQVDAPNSFELLVKQIFKVATEQKKEKD